MEFCYFDSDFNSAFFKAFSTLPFSQSLGEYGQNNAHETAEASCCGREIARLGAASLLGKFGLTFLSCKVGSLEWIVSKANNVTLLQFLKAM